MPKGRKDVSSCSTKSTKSFLFTATICWLKQEYMADQQWCLHLAVGYALNTSVNMHLCIAPTNGSVFPRPLNKIISKPKALCKVPTEASASWLT